MERIVKFIAGYKSLFTFLICLFLSTLLLFSNNSTQVFALRSILVDVSTSITAPLNLFIQVFKALDENKRLKAENVRLSYENSLTQQKNMEILRLRGLLDLKEKSGFELVSGSIIAWGAVPIPNSITINLGTDDGINKNDPVISVNGLVGKVQTAGRKSSVCQLLTDRNFKVSSIAKRARAFGLLRWNKDNLAVMDVHKSSVVAEGDTVVTSEHGNIYPEGIPIGRIESFYDGPELFKIVNVRLFVDYLQLYDVVVYVKKPVGR